MQYRLYTFYPCGQAIAGGGSATSLLSIDLRKSEVYNSP